MALIVGTRKNTLTGRTKEYRFHASCADTISSDELIDTIARSNQGLSRDEVELAFRLLSGTIAELVADGNYVKTPFGSFFLSAIGLADSPESDFKPGAKQGHGLRLRFRPERSFENKICDMASISRDDVSWQKFPKPKELCVENKKQKPKLLPGTIVRLTGENLAFDAEDELQGVFFVKSISDTGLRAENYIKIKPKKLVFSLAEDMEEGEYTVVVRTSTKSGIIRSGYLDGKVLIESQ